MNPFELSLYIPEDHCAGVRKFPNHFPDFSLTFLSSFWAAVAVWFLPCDGDVFPSRNFLFYSPFLILVYFYKM